MNLTTDYKKITLDGTETAVTFPRVYPVFVVKGVDILISLSANITEGADNVRSTADHDGCYIWSHNENTDTMYLKGTGEVVVAAFDSTVAAMADFKKTGKGGGGSGDTTAYKGTTTTAIENGSTTNPITIDGESYTAVFGDIVVYNYTEFVFDGTQWGEFGRPFDTVPTGNSANAVTSDGIYRNTAGQKYFVNGVVKGEKFNNAVEASGNYSHAEGYGTRATGLCAHAEGGSSTASGNYSHAEGTSTASGNYSHAEGNGSVASGNYSHAEGVKTQANQESMTAIGRYNSPNTGDIFNIGNGTAENARSNIVEVNSTSMNINGDIQKNGVSLPTPYTTMPTITAAMLGQIAQYVGATNANYTQGYFYIASSDGQTEPTYSWVNLPVSPRTYSEAVLWANDSTTNPSTISLSSAYTNYDAIVIVHKHTEASELYTSTATYLTSAMDIDDMIGISLGDAPSLYTWYKLTAANELTEQISGLILHSIIGIKY